MSFKAVDDNEINRCTAAVLSAKKKSRDCDLRMLVNLNRVNKKKKKSSVHFKIMFSVNVNMTKAQNRQVFQVCIQTVFRII